MLPLYSIVNVLTIIYDIVYLSSSTLVLILSTINLVLNRHETHKIL